MCNKLIFKALLACWFALSGLNAWAAPTIDVWYGPNQSFGGIGQPQRWVNVLGNVSAPDGINSLTYTLNGEPSLPLSIGPDSLRLVAAGDFNVELAYSDLLVGANSVVITATDGLGAQSTATVTVNYAGVNVWPKSYSTNWAAALNISEQAQIIDGLWTLESSSVRPLLLGYDRLLGIGDVTWDNFEATVPITVHGLDPFCSGVTWQCAGDPGVGLLIRWQGHYDEDGSQPRWGYTPLGAIGWMRWNRTNLSNDRLALEGSNGDFGILSSKNLPFGVTHILKLRAETDALGHNYSVKIWEQGTSEPVGWDIVGQDALTSGLGYGSLLLLAHHVDASFGDVSITPLSSDTTPPLISNIQAFPADSSATITWTTDEPANSAVAYGSSTAYENGTINDGFFVTSHSITLTGLTASTTYHYQVTTIDASGNASNSTDLIFTTTDATNPAGIVPDLFDGTGLDTGIWAVVDPLGDSTVSVASGQLSISVPAGVEHDVWTAGNDAPRIMQSVGNADFDVEIKLDSTLTTQFQMQGLIAEQDSSNFIRFDFFSDGSNTKVFAASFVNGNPTIRINQAITAATPLYLRVKRSGDLWTQQYSYDGATWTTAISFSHPLNMTSIGLFGANAGTTPPAHTALFDYISVNPVSVDTTPPLISNIQVDVTDAIASVSWQTDEQADSSIAYGQTTGYEIGFSSDNNPKTSHVMTLTNLLPGLTYYYQISSADSNDNTANSSGLTFTTKTADPGVSGGVSSADTEVTYKEYWVSHNEFTSGCGVNAQLPPQFYIEPDKGCTKTVTLNIPDDISQALKAEIYLDLWRNHDVPSVDFVLNGNPTTYVPDVGSDWSRTPYVGQVLMSELVQGVNTLAFTGPGGALQIHDIAIRIFYDDTNPLLPGAGSDVTPPSGSLTTIQADNGSFSASAGGTLVVDTNQLVFNAVAGDADYVEFHGFYYGYDENNDQVFQDWHNVKRLEKNPGPNGTIDHIGTDTSSPYSVAWDLSHIPNQGRVRFKLRVVDSAGNVRESAGGISAEFELSRAQLVESYLIQSFEDVVLNHGGTLPTLATRNIYLPANLSDVTAAYMVGAYWRNPFISLNSNPQFAAFSGAEDSWALSVRPLTLTDLVPGNNQIDYTYLGTGFGEFIEKPGPMLVLMRSRPGAPSSGFVSDGFDGPSLDTNVWTAIDPIGDSTITVAGSQVSIAVPSGISHDVRNEGNFAARVVQPVSDSNFAAEIKFDSVPTTAGQGQGLLVEEDANEYLLFEARSNTSGTYITTVRYADGTPATISNVAVSMGGSLYLRVERNGNVWDQFYSGDGVSWTSLPSFTQNMFIRNIGAYASNTGTSPAHTVLVDYLNNKQPVIDTQPANQSVIEGQSAIFTVSATGSGLLTYQWQRDGVDIAGEIAASYTLPVATLLDNNAAFRVIVTSSEGITATSNTVILTVNSPVRITTGQQALYTFQEGSGLTVTDVSGAGSPLDLTIADPGQVSWLPGALAVNGSTLIASAGAATGLISSAQSSNELTMEAWLRPANTTQSGPARIVSLSSDPTNRNLTLGQELTGYNMRVRTTATDNNGQPSLTSANGTLITNLTHVVFTRDAGGVTRLYIDGAEISTGATAGNFSNWDTGYSFGLANELTGDRPWLGELHLVAVFNRALAASEVSHNYNIGFNANAPVAVSDAFTVNEYSSLNVLDVKANDTDADGNFLSVVTVGTPDQGGTIVINNNGTLGTISDDFIEYTPVPGFIGVETFTYDISDGNYTSQASISVTVININRGPPVAVDDPAAATIPEDTAVTTVNVLANDTLVDNAAITAFDNPSANGGTVVNNGDGTFNYAPAPGFNGTDSFTYTLTDDEAETSTATVTITVTAVNNGLPAAVADPTAATTPEDTAVATVNVLANDTLTDNATITAFDNPSVNGGTVVNNGDGTFNYTPASGFNGADSFTYTLTDDEAETATATVTVSVTAVNNGLPVAVADPTAATTPEDTVVITVNVLANDTLVDNAVITAFDNPSANGGTVVNNGNGTFNYTPAPGFNGTDSFTYTLTDDEAETSTATVTITVAAVNNGLPVAVDDPTAATTPEDTAVTTVNVLANDTLVDNAVITAFDNPSVNGGTVVNNGDGTFSYTPASGFNGTDSFTYTLTDDEAETATATVTVSVTAVNNGLPVAIDDPTAATTPEDAVVATIDVLANDTLVDNAVITSFDNPSANGGTVVNNGDGTFNYTPAPGFNGTDSFTYTLTDDEAETATATVTVSVTAVNNGLPVAIDDPAAATIPEDTVVATIDVLANDTLIDNATITAFDNPSVNGGTVVYNGDGTFNYTPAPGFNGTDSFTYTLTDDEAETATATVTVSVTAVNNGLPVAVDDPTAATTPEDTAVITINVLANDTLVDNAVITAFDNPSVNGGTVVNNGDGTFTYTPAPGFNGTDSFTYTLTDDEAEMSTATVTITVTAFVPDGDLAPRGAPDGQLNAADLLIMYRIVMGEPPTAIDLMHGDLYPVGAPDGIINLSDLILLQNLVLGAGAP